MDLAKILVDNLWMNHPFVHTIVDEGYDTHPKGNTDLGGQTGRPTSKKLNCGKAGDNRRAYRPI